MDPAGVLPAQQILDLLQLLLQLLDARVLYPRRDAALLNPSHKVLDVVQIPFDLAQNVVPQLEARVALDTLGEDAGETPGALVAALPGRSLPAAAGSRHPVALSDL